MIARLGAALFVACVATGAAGCDQLPLLAPSASTISLAVISAPGGGIQIVATVLEASGTPVHNGTLVSFTTTVGRLEPTEARTHNGKVSVDFHGEGQSGVAEIRANSGSAALTPDGGLLINVGSAAVARIQMSATPNPVSSNSGTSEIVAFVTDAVGSPLPAVLVSFSTNAGTLSSSSATTDASGRAATTLTTNAEATVTAVAGLGADGAGVTGTVIVRIIGLTVTPPAATPIAGEATALTVTPVGDGTIRNVTLNFGDGTSVSLGTVAAAVAVPHVYQSGGTYVATATGDLNGQTVSGSTSVVVLPSPPLNVTIGVSPTPPMDDSPVTFTATVLPATAQIVQYDWSFGDGETATTSGNIIIHVYETFGRRTVRVTVRDVNGRTASATTQIQVER